MQTCPIPTTLPFTAPSKLRFLRRCTLTLTDSAQNHRLRDLNAAYDIVALRPTDEKTLLQACQNLDCDLVSLDLTIRYSFHFPFGTVAAALNRGLKFEICYSPGILANDSRARTNLISNATQLIRATRGRGIILSSEASRAQGCRGPWDVANLAAIWGLSQERGKEAVSNAARSVVVSAALKRSSYRGVIDIVYAGEKPGARDTASNGKAINKKRANGQMDADTNWTEKPEEQLSNREKKRRAKLLREDVAKQTDSGDTMQT